MPPHYRLSRTEFTRMRGFKRVVGELLSLSYGTLSGRRSPGAACVVSSKTAPHAVDRNRLRRLCREALLPFLKTMPETQVVVIHVKKGAVSTSSHELVREIAMLIKKAEIIA